MLIQTAQSNCPYTHFTLLLSFHHILIENYTDHLSIVCLRRSLLRFFAYYQQMELNLFHYILSGYLLQHLFHLFYLCIFCSIFSIFLSFPYFYLFHCRSEEKSPSMETIEEKLGRATNYLHDIKVIRFKL